MHKSSISYYQKKINRIYGEHVIHVVKNFHKKHKIYLKMYVYPKHMYISKRSDQAYHLQHFLKDNAKIRFDHAQHVLNKNYGRGAFTLLSYRNDHSLMTVRHNSPVCGYHISHIPAETLSKTAYRDSKYAPCCWCRHMHEYSDAYFRFLVGRIGCGQYTYLGKRRIQTPKTHSMETQIKLRHNCQLCNYYTYWIDPSHFVNDHNRCIVCARKLAGQRFALSNGQFLLKVLSMPNNKHLMFIPASRYKNWKHKMLWWHMTLPAPHLFYMTPNNFFSGQIKRCPYESCSQPERLTLQWLHKHGLVVARDYDFGHIIHHGPLKTMHLDFLLRNNVTLEIQGGQHVTPVYTDHENGLQHTKAVQHRDRMKAFYTTNYGINLFHIRAYKWIYHSKIYGHPYATEFNNPKNFKRCIWSQLDALAPIILRGLPKKS